MVALLLLLLFLPLSAHAYVLCDTEGDGSGETLHWPGEQITWYTQYLGHEDYLPLIHDDRMRDSMGVWTGVSPSSLRVADAGYRTLGQTAYDEYSTLYYLGEGWEFGPEIIALTTTQYFDDGEIVDSDLAFNGEDYQWTINRLGDVRTDIMSIAVHEMGHAVGMCHTPDRWATMYAAYSQGEVHQRDLETDDIEGLAALYPCDSGNCRSSVENLVDAGCRAHLGRGMGSGPLALVLAVLLLGLRARRKGFGTAQEGGGQSPRPTLLIALGLSTVLGWGVSQAATLNLHDLAELMGATEVLVRVTVEESETYTDSRGHYRSRYSVVVEQSLKGQILAGRTLEVDVLGGKGEGQGTLVAGGVRMSEGDHRLLFLAPRNDGSYRVVGLEAGCWIAQWRGRELLFLASPLARQVLGASVRSPWTLRSLQALLENLPKSP